MINNEKNIAFWDRAAHQSKSNKKAFAGMLEGREFEAIYRCEAEQERFLQQFSPTQTSRVLEVGSGGGRWGFFLADKVGTYVGLDISSNMVAIAEEERTRLNLSNVRFECCSLFDYKADQKFDLVYFSGVLQYMDDDVVKQCIAKASSILSADGFIVSRDSVQTAQRMEKTGEYPVIYRAEAEYRAFFEAGGFALDYSNLSYQHKRFTGLASRLYMIPGVTYKMAYAVREGLCLLDNLFGNPSILKTKKHKAELKEENPQEHRFFKYVRKNDDPKK
jgi:SAM-dependent methyltransferase